MAEATHIENGYVLLARRLFDSRLWNCPPDTFRVAIFLLLKARHKSTPHKLPDGSNIHRGELVTSYADISDNCAWYENRRERQYSRQKVNRILTELINIGFCEKKSDSYGTHLSICNYETYQIPENYNSDNRVTTAEQPRDNSVTTPDTNKNVKNEENVKNTPHTPLGGKSPKEPTKAEIHDAAVKNAEFPPEIDTAQLREAFFEFASERRDKREYMTERAVKNMLSKLSRYKPEGAVEALQDSIANGYKGVFPKRQNQPNLATGQVVKSDDPPPF